MKQLTAFLAVVFLFSCEPLVTNFRDIEDAVLYESSSKTNVPYPPDSLLVMTWNVRFGAGRTPWFGEDLPGLYPGGGDGGSGPHRLGPQH